MEEIVKNEINKFDPVGLFPHAPDDEYEVEIAQIVEFMKNTKPIDEKVLGEYIYNVFLKAFDTDSYFCTSFESFTEVASKILDKL